MITYLGVRKDSGRGRSTLFVLYCPRYPRLFSTAGLDRIVQLLCGELTSTESSVPYRLAPSCVETWSAAPNSGSLPSSDCCGCGSTTEVLAQLWMPLRPLSLCFLFAPAPPRVLADV